MSSLILIDTDILSAWLKRDASVIEHARRHLASGGDIGLSVITRFEIIRGLKAKSATAQLSRFEHWCSSRPMFDVTMAVADRAASFYSLLANRGQLIGDADLLIAATAQEFGCTLATNNQSHFSRIKSADRELVVRSIV